MILCWIENFELSLGKLHNSIPDFGILGADYDVMTLDTPWTCGNDRLAVTFSPHDASMVRSVGDVGLCIANWNGPRAHQPAFVRPATASEDRNDNQTEPDTHMRLTLEVSYFV